jgi:hypothetical protein
VTFTLWSAIRTSVERWGPTLPAAFSWTGVGPAPAAGPAIVSQLAPLVDVQEHPAAAVTDTDAVPAAAPNETEVGATLNVHPEAWLTVKGCPAIVSVATRAGPLFVAAENPTVPAPLPETLPVRAIHAAPLLADQPHPAAVVIDVDPVPPPAGTDAASGVTVYTQPSRCVTFTH